MGWLRMPILWTMVLGIAGLWGAARHARAQQGCYNEACASSSETMPVCNGGCVITVPLFYGYGTYNGDFISECVQCGSCSGVLNWTYDGYCYTDAPAKQPTGEVVVPVYVCVRGCDGNYSVLKLTFPA